MTETGGLDHFVRAQEETLQTVRTELRAGRKETHWMWFVFPQLRGLGRSAMAERYAIASLGEARAYLTHPLLGPRLMTCTELALAIEGRTAREVFGTPDDMKFCSSMTLFALAADRPAVFKAALTHYFDGVPDSATIALLARPAAPGDMARSA